MLSPPVLEEMRGLRANGGGVPKWEEAAPSPPNPAGLPAAGGTAWGGHGWAWALPWSVTRPPSNPPPPMLGFPVSSPLSWPGAGGRLLFHVLSVRRLLGRVPGGVGPTCSWLAAAAPWWPAVGTAGGRERGKRGGHWAPCRETLWWLPGEPRLAQDTGRFLHQARGLASRKQSELALRWSYLLCTLRRRLPGHCWGHGGPAARV